MRSMGRRMKMKAGRLPMAPALILAMALACSLPVVGGAQERPTLTPDDYDRWERLGPAVFSPDGEWLAVSTRSASASSVTRGAAIKRRTS